MLGIKILYETLKTGGDETGFVIYSKGSDNKEYLVIMNLKIGLSA